MRRHIKKFFFMFYLPVIIVAAAVGLAVALRRPQCLGFLASLAVAHFAQRYQLEELSFSYRLFTDFNSRYDRLNNGLQDIVCESRHLTSGDRSTLLDYFNLCSEEYYFYSQGFVPGPVWRAWCRGMLEYLEDARVAQVWREEEARGSYYGLTYSIVEQGAARDKRDSTLVSVPRAA